MRLLQSSALNSRNISRGIRRPAFTFPGSLSVVIGSGTPFVLRRLLCCKSWRKTCQRRVPVGMRCYTGNRFRTGLIALGFP